MRWTALAAALVVAACSGGGVEAATTTTTTTEAPTTTEAQSPDEAFLDDLRDEVGFTNPQWGEEAIDVAKQVCETLDAGRDTINDATATQQYADMTLSAVYETAGEDQRATAAVLVLGAEHFCREHRLAVEGDAIARGYPISVSG